MRSAIPAISLKRCGGFLEDIFAEKAEAVAACVFDCVHRGVGGLEQVFGFEAEAGIDADAGAEGDVDRAVADDDRLRRALQQLRTAAADIFEIVDVGHDDDELIAAETGDGIHFAHGGEQTLGDGAEQRIAVGVAEGVVDALKVIDVNHEDGGRGIIDAKVSAGP